MKAIVDATTERTLSDRELVRFYQSMGGRLPLGQTPAKLLESETQRQASGARIAALIEQDRQHGRPRIPDADLVRLFRALR
jgi:hypothetical protein